VKKKSVIAVGRLSFEKGFDYLIDVWKIINQRFPDWILDMYGHGELKTELQNRIDTSGLSAVIKLKGVTNDIVTEYQSHSIYIMTSRNEGFPLVLIEASSCGLPIVSFDCPNGPNEIVMHGDNGFLVSPVGNVKMMASYLMQLMSDETLRKRMGCCSFELSKRFKLENIASEWINLYNQLLCL
jgi:glycosyltransferase, group 1 family